jgi:hypothetical protein
VREPNPLESMHKGLEKEGSKSSSKLQNRRVLARTRAISANREKKKEEKKADVLL